jgi:peptide/nickel transport system substrate-binding protein
MLKLRRSASVSSVAMIAILLLACSPARVPEVSQSVDPARTEQSSGRKVVTIAIQQEPSNIGGIVEGTGSSSGAKNADGIAHQMLAIEADIGTYEPQLAAEMISVERGTWRLNPDGTMDTAWKLRPNIKWHDGTPFTSQDLLFTYTVFQDPDLPATGSQRRLMTSASAPDPATFVVHWSSLCVDANRGQIGVILPKHLLEKAYRDDKSSLPNHPYFTTSFIGLGPYRLASFSSPAGYEAPTGC